MRARAFFNTRFAIRLGRDSGADHWSGGVGNYKTDDCPVCHARLQLLLDFNCEDPVLRKASRGKLASLKRLPLFVCARCWCELSYSVDDQMHVKVIQTRYGTPGGEPYAEFPDQFDRKPLALDDSVPSELPKVVSKWNPDIDLRGENLSKGERKLLEDFFGHPIFMPRFMYHHQLGGDSLFESWDEKAFVCPNKKCGGGW